MPRARQLTVIAAIAMCLSFNGIFLEFAGDYVNQIGANQVIAPCLFVLALYASRDIQCKCLGFTG